MTEAKLRGQALNLFREKHPRAVVFRHEDMFRAGVPDTSINWKGMTSWIEFKHANPTVKWRGTQAAEMQRLWSTGVPAYYAIYRESKGEQTLLIVAASPRYKELQTPYTTLGFNHQYLIEFLERIHSGFHTN